MTCFEFEEHIQTQLDLHVQCFSEELSAHASICGSCHTLLKHLQFIDAVTAQWGEMEPSFDFSAEVIKAYNASTDAETASPTTMPIQSMSALNSVATPFSVGLDALQRRTAMGPALAALVASAVAVSVMFAFGWRTSQNAQLAHQQSTNSNRVIANQSPPTQLPTGSTERQLDVLIHDAREAYSALASQALQHVSTANFLLPPTETTSPFRSNDTMNGFPDALSRPLSPWGNEFRDAVDSLFDRIFTSQDSST